MTLQREGDEAEGLQDSHDWGSHWTENNIYVGKQNFVAVRYRGKD